MGNWSADTVSSYALDPMTGAPTEVEGSPFPSGPAPIVHVVDASNQFLYATNQGVPVVEAFAIGALGNLTEVQGSPFLAGDSPTAIVAVP